MLPFDAYPGKGRRLLGPPKAGTGSSRTGYGLALQRMTGQSACAYCGLDLVADFHRWLLLTVDHVVPRAEAQHLGIPPMFYEDAVNLVLACSGCNGYLNQYQVANEPSAEWTIEAFADLRDSVFRDRHQRIEERRIQEQAIFDKLVEAHRSDALRTHPTPPKGVATFVDDDAGYLGWLSDWPEGFVVNTARRPEANYVVLHRATCGTISSKPARGSQWTKDYIKICSADLGALQEWARQATGGELRPCGSCRPLQMP